MIHFYLAYATSKGSWHFFWELLKFRRLAAWDPGVAQVEILIAVSEGVHTAIGTSGNSRPPQL